MGNSWRIILYGIGILLYLLSEGLAGKNVATQEMKKGYELLAFDTALGIFDQNIDTQLKMEYMRLWKKARKINYILNPDRAHGRECGKYRYLKSTKILKSRFLSQFVIFLISPGLRPCDYDEKCQTAKDLADATCAHTQYIKDFPVIIDPAGTPYHKYSMNIEFLNALLKSENITIKNESEALELVKLSVFLTNPKSRRVKEDRLNFSILNKDCVRKIIFALKSSPEAKFEKSELWEFRVDSSGIIQEKKRAVIKGDK
jgi:hypothetical protein